ncbi:type II secretion system F family protein [Luteococcus peritonei]|uniref:Type II secretion system F family protein n=1 Tax=Luteococcus peritonei TaxID=88874 RepID=A0ABW4RVI9_9ACTN
MTVLAALWAGLSVWLLVGPTPRVVATRASTGRRTGAQLPAVLAGGAACLIGLLLAGPSGLLWALLGVVVVGTGARLALRSRREATRRRARQQVCQATQVVAGQLRIGALPGAALTQAAKQCPRLERAAATQAIGGDVARALDEAGTQPGWEGLGSLSRAWRLAERSGAPMASLAEQVSLQVRREDASRHQVQAELSGPRTTARLLLVLPLMGILMGRFAGGDPLDFLTGSLLGQACLVAGAVLAAAGTLWIEHMADAAQEA